MNRAAPFRSLVFAAVAGLASIPWMMLAGPLLGNSGAWSVAVLASAVLYTISIAPSWPRALSSGAVATTLSTLAAVFASNVSEVALAAASIIAICRSGLLYRRRTARALAIETVLSLGGLLFARYLAGPSALATGLAIWGYFLVQSLYSILGGSQPRESDSTGLDPFDEAERRALAVLRGEGRV